jgi:hypothetical protein
MADKITRFFTSLYFTTLDDKVQWDKALADDTYQTSFDNYSVRISKWCYPPNEEEYFITIIDTEGEEIARIGPADLDNVTYNGKSPWQAFRELFEKVRRTALGVEKALDDLLQSLDKLRTPRSDDVDADDIPF